MVGTPGTRAQPYGLARRLRTMRNSLGRILIAVLVAAGALVVPASSAYACSCIAASPRAHMHHSDAVFTGRLVKVETPSDRSRIQSSGDPRVLTFEVDRVYKGAVASLEEVGTVADGAACGLGLRGEGPFLVFASATEAKPGKPRYSSYLCSGTRRVADDESVPAGFGAGSPPGGMPSQPTDEPALVAGPAASAEDADAASFSPGFMAATVLALAGAVLPVLWRLRRPTGR